MYLAHAARRHQLPLHDRYRRLGTARLWCGTCVDGTIRCDQDKSVGDQFHRLDYFDFDSSSGSVYRRS